MRAAALIWKTALLMALALPAAAEAPLLALNTLNDSKGWEAVGKLVLGDRGFCTGALIAPHLVLTAAHCLFDKETGARLKPEEIKFLAGWQNGRAEAYRGVRQAVAHPDYAYGGADALDRVADDIALIELDQPILLPGVKPFAVGAAPGAGDRVGVVSYAQERAETPSLQEDCSVVDRQEGILVMTCDVDFGSSGAPVFRIGPEGVEIVSVVSAKADMQGQKVALGSGLEIPLKALTKALKQADHRPGNVQVLSGGQASGSAKFVKPEAKEAP